MLVDDHDDARSIGSAAAGEAAEVAAASASTSRGIIPPHAAADRRQLAVETIISGIDHGLVILNGNAPALGGALRDLRETLIRDAA